MLLFVMVEQLCVNISKKSFKKPETQLHPVLIISLPCRSQASDVEETECRPFREVGARQKGSPPASEGQVPATPPQAGCDGAERLQGGGGGC